MLMVLLLYFSMSVTAFAAEVPVLSIVVIALCTLYSFMVSATPRNLRFCCMILQVNQMVVTVHDNIVDACHGAPLNSK